MSSPSLWFLQFALTLCAAKAAAEEFTHREKRLDVLGEPPKIPEGCTKTMSWRWAGSSRLLKSKESHFLCVHCLNSTEGSTVHVRRAQFPWRKTPKSQQGNKVSVTVAHTFTLECFLIMLHQHAAYAPKSRSVSVLPHRRSSLGA
ncbi:hypothetical protein EI94DRAFT_272835 [Lactarius quietus]|nr:hypothetical protein EI94DRAFT_272835 [Lactarius quietus]